MSHDDENRIYFSFGPDPAAMRSRRRPVGVRFESKELEELGVAMFFITIAFAVVFSDNYLLHGSFNPRAFLLALPFSFVATLTGFFLHEVAHKISANHYGFPAAFSYNKRTLIFLSIFSIIVGFLIVAPGAVYIYGRPNRKENGVISAAGPGTNMIVGYGVAMISIPVMFFSSYLGSGLFLVGLLNLFIGAFNMIPIMPFDGSKIWKWNQAVYIVMLIFLLGPVLFFFFGFGRLFLNVFGV
ncbi:MAG: site-2 protease family protein [Thermoplasmatota archaeon]